MTAENLLSKLDKVKRTGAGRWKACCPAHADKGPSLSIRELDDGRVLCKCFAGCTISEVLAAAGLDMAELFPPRETTYDGPPERRPFPAADALRAVAFEALVVVAAASALVAGEPISTMDRERLSLASGRIQGALRSAGL
jgi:hypothetical protein